MRVVFAIAICAVALACTAEQRQTTRTVVDVVKAFCSIQQTVDSCIAKLDGEPEKPIPVQLDAGQ